MQSAWKILVIDDSLMSLQVVDAYLTENGFDIRTTDKLDEFDRLLGQWRPNLILTDVNMPGMSGPELCSKLKSMYETSEIPIVLFSSLSNDELAALARQCSADGFLTKVNGLENLVEEIRALCESLSW